MRWAATNNVLLLVYITRSLLFQFEFVIIHKMFMIRCKMIRSSKIQSCKFAWLLANDSVWPQRNWNEKKTQSERWWPAFERKFRLTMSCKTIYNAKEYILSFTADFVTTISTGVTVSSFNLKERITSILNYSTAFIPILRAL